MIRLRQGYGGQVALVDYGAGNLTSVRKAFAALGAEIATPRAPGDLASARGIVVPGVGHFDATTAIDGGWRDAIRTRVEAGVPLLGICLGLQWLFASSTEAPGVAGLGVFEGTCERLGETRGKGDSPLFPDASPEGKRGQSPFPRSPSPFPQSPSSTLKVPHVGWNSLSLPRTSAILAGVPEDAQVYFTHSYAAPVVADTAAVTEYGIAFSAAVEREHIAGVQFHPEKSGDVGLLILRNWIDAL